MIILRIEYDGKYVSQRYYLGTAPLLVEFDGVTYTRTDSYSWGGDSSMHIYKHIMPFMFDDNTWKSIDVISIKYIEHPMYRMYLDIDIELNQHKLHEII